jgi:hypothetical protein
MLSHDFEYESFFIQRAFQSSGTFRCSIAFARISYITFRVLHFHREETCLANHLGFSATKRSPPRKSCFIQTWRRSCVPWLIIWVKRQLLRRPSLFSQYGKKTMALEVTEWAMEGFSDHISPEVLGALQKIIGSALKDSQFEGLHKQQNAADFSDVGQQDPEFKNGQSASEALRAALNKSAAFLKAEGTFAEFSIQQWSEVEPKGLTGLFSVR